MVDIPTTIRQLSANARAIQSLVEGISPEQESWKPGPESWSLKDTLEHLYNEERIDFRKHLGELLHQPPQAWGTGGPEEWLRVSSCIEALQGFRGEREASLAWLQSLETSPAAPNWSAEQAVPFGPSGERMTIQAGDVLVSWVAHDHLHLRQINELLFAWNERQAAPHSVQYAGGW